MFRDRKTPIKDQAIILSQEGQELFENLKLSPQEKDWLALTPNELTEEALTGNKKPLVTIFRTKLDCHPVAHGLLNNQSTTAMQNIERLSTHLTGGVLDKYVSRDLHKIRDNSVLQARIRPVLGDLIEAASENLQQYVNRHQPEVLDKNYRNFHVLSAMAARLSPSPEPELQGHFSRILGSYKSELSPSLMLVSLPAMGYKPEISDWDVKYVEPWNINFDGPEGRARGLNVAAYNAPPDIGWSLLQLNPRHAKDFLKGRRARIERSLIDETERKCCTDPCVNPAWLAARLFKLDLALHSINGRHPYSRLPFDLARKVKKIARAVRKGLEGAMAFNGKADALRLARSIESWLTI